MTNATTLPTRNFRGDPPGTYADVVLTVLKRTYGGTPHAAKRLAQAARTSYRTAENWLMGANAPSGEALINLMAECEELAEEVGRLVAERRQAKRDN